MDQAPLFPPMPNPGVLQAFIALQTAGFYGWLYSSVRKYNETGVLPPELFGESGKLRSEEKGRRGRKPGHVKKPRPMNAFNYFVQQKMNEYKAKGVKPPNDGDNKTLFAMAVNEWKELDTEARDQFTADFKISHPKVEPVPEEHEHEVHEEEYDEGAAEGAEGPLEGDHEEEFGLPIAPLDLHIGSEGDIVKKEKKKKKEEVKLEPERVSKRDRKPKTIEDLGAEPEKKKKHKKF